MPFGEYQSFEECTREHSDKDDPEAYCAEIHYQITGEYPGQNQAADFHDSADRYAKYALEAMKEAGKEPSEERLAAISMKAQMMIDEAEYKQDDPERICGDLWFNQHQRHGNSFGNGSQGRGPDEQPPEPWWNDCVATISERGRESIDVEGEE